MTSKDEQFERSATVESGAKVYEELYGTDVYEQAKRIMKLFPDYQNYAWKNLFGELYARPGLDDRTRQISLITTLINQRAFPMLKLHLRGALHMGFTKEELLELILFTSAHAGYPSSSIALMAMTEVLNDIEAEKK